MPDQMFHYRSAVFLIRAYYPEVLLGLRTTDELEDTEAVSPATAAPDGRTRSDVLADLIGAAPEDNPADEQEQEKPEEEKPAPDASGELFDQGDAYEGDIHADEPPPEAATSGGRRRSRVE